MRVYRVEDAEGYGPFQGGRGEALHDALLANNHQGALLADMAGECWHSWARERGGDYLFPTPWNDPLIGRTWEGFGWARIDPRVGCLSLRDIVTWFPKPCRSVLKDEGFRLTLWEVKEGEVLAGTRQCLFDRSNSHLVTSRPL